jgi:hypothetical protein
MVDIKTRTENLGPHIDPTELVLFDEGQLSTESTARIEHHLMNCRRCQEELEEIQAGVAAYVSFHRSMYSETLSPPPNGWRDFEERLSRCRIEEGVQRQVLSSSELEEPDSTNQRIFEDTKRGWNDSHPVGFQWAVAMGVATLTIAVGVFCVTSNSGKKASAVEIIQNASEKQARDFRVVQHPVVYQKVKIDRSSRGTPAAESIVMETWKDVERSRIREKTEAWLPGSAGEAVSHRPAVSSAAIPLTVRNLRAIYESNHLNQDSPISLNSFSQWVHASPQKKETVEELRRDGKVKAYRITAEAADPIADDAIRSFQIEVRAEDWHPIRENFVVADHGGEQTYEIAELDYRVVPLSELNRHLWDTVSDLPHGVRPIPESTLPRLATPSESELLIDGLARLDRTEGLTEDQIRIERKDGIVHIRGVVTGEARKAEILAAFNRLANRANIEFDIRSGISASGVQSKPIEAQPVTIPINSEEGNAEVRRYLATTQHLTGSALEEEVQHFTMTALDRSTQAQQHAQALEQLVMAVPERDRQALNKEASELWRSLALRHLQRVRQEAMNLRDQLSPLSSEFSGSTSSSAAVNVAGDLDSQVKQISELANRNDRTLWEVLSTSSVRASNPRLLSPSDVRSLDAEIRLAASIEQMLEHSGTRH